MIARSLRLRLLLGAACAIFAALAVAWLAMSYLFERHIERQVEADLGARGLEVIAALYRDPNGAYAIDPAPSEPRFNAPSSGLYWQVSAGGVQLRSRSLWDETLPAPAERSTARWVEGTAPGPFGQELLYVAREVQPDADGPRFTVVVATDRAELRAARAAFSRELGLFLVLLWAALAAAAWAQVELGLRPLEDVRAALGGMRKQASVRLAESDYPTEAAPLANAINDLADARERDLEHARWRAGDLAHSLKTPLSSLSAQSRRVRESGAGEAADGLDRAIAAARGAVERELVRARAAASRENATADGRAAMAKLIQVIERTEHGARLAFENGVGNSPYPVGEDLLLEMVGPLLENAARFAATHVRVEGDGAVLAVEDDGPGLNESEALAVLERGKRLDESGDGQGFGLAIAHELAQASGAVMTLTRSALGGLRVEIAWP